MAAPIVPSNLYQQAVFETMKAANKAAQQPSFGPDYNPAESMMPLTPPYIFDHNLNQDHFVI